MSSPPSIVVKIGLQGQAFVDYRPVSQEELLRAVREVAAAGGHLTYYREAPETDGSEAAAATFRAIVELRPAIRLGSEAPSEWGRLDWVELERRPQASRFFLARGQRFLVAPSPAEPIRVGGPLAAEAEESWLRQLDLLLRSDRVIESPMREPDPAMQEGVGEDGSLHLRIAYDSRRWAAWFPLPEVPPHLKTFHDDLWRVGRRLVAAVDRESAGQA